MGQGTQATLVNAVGNLDVRRHEGKLVVDQERTLFLRRQPSGRLDCQTTGHIHGDRLGQVDMAASLDGVLGLLGMEVSDVLQRYRFHTAFNQSPATRQAREATRLFHLKGIATSVHGILEIVGQGVQLKSTMLLEEVGDPVSPSAATNHSQLDLAPDVFGRCGGRIGRGGCSRRAKGWTRRPWPRSPGKRAW